MISHTEDSQIGKKKLQQARDTIKQFLNAVKTFSIYSENHANCRRAASCFHASLVSFLDDYDRLRISITRAEFLYEGAVVHSVAANQDIIGYSLFRDGIKSLGFERGVTLKETEKFLQILQKYRQLDEGSPEDLVTALWEANLINIHYQATALFLENVGPLAVMEEARPESLLSETDVAFLEEHLAEDQGPINLPADSLRTVQNDPLPVGLILEELDMLKAEVRQEQSQGTRQSVVEMLLDILLVQEDEELLSLSADFLREEVETAISERAYDLALTVVRRLRHILARPSGEKVSSAPFIEQLFRRIAGEDFLRLLQSQWSDPKCPDLSNIRQFLQLLPPVAISAIGPMLADPLSGQSRKMLLEVITALAAEDMKPLESLLARASQDVLESLIFVLAGLRGERTIQHLLSLTRHQSDRLRLLALETLIKKRVWLPQELFHLIEDSNERVRQLFLSYLGSRRCETAEQLLAAHVAKGIKTGVYSVSCSDFIITLGRCGSTRSVSLLLELLCQGVFVTKMTGSPLRKAAAIALRQIGTDEALSVLGKAARSLYPGVRQAARTANCSQVT